MENTPRNHVRSKFAILHQFISLIFLLLLVMVIAESVYAENVDDKTDYTIANTRWDRATGVTSMDVTITNTSNQNLYGPLIAIAKNINPPRTVANADGTKNGAPYWDYTSQLSKIISARQQRYQAIGI
jgi:hypothetical protein